MEQAIAMGGTLCDEPDFSTFENKTGLAEDMKFLASMPELCDVTFLVGDTREPVCAVKAVLAARSRSASKHSPPISTISSNKQANTHIMKHTFATL